MKLNYKINSENILGMGSLGIALCLVLLSLLVHTSSIIATTPALTPFSPPTDITVNMNRLVYPSGGNGNEPCTVEPRDKKWGCTRFDEDHYEPEDVHPYPYAFNPVTVDIETDYLLDVVPQELAIYYDAVALSAQAVAARTYAYRFINEEEPINNSASKQAFIPYTFESTTGIPNQSNFPSNPQYPCNSNNLNHYQKIVCDAVADPYYMTHHSTADEPAFAEFSSDVVGQTITHANPTEYPYLMSVEDPISNSCDADNYGHGKGMSQEGASRWARGDQCSKNVAGNQPWSVQWKDYRQILTHYYTGIHLRNFDTQVVTPDKRWRTRCSRFQFFRNISC